MRPSAARARSSAVRPASLPSGDFSSGLPPFITCSLGGPNRDDHTIMSSVWSPNRRPFSLTGSPECDAVLRKPGCQPSASSFSSCSPSCAIWRSKSAARCFSCVTTSAGALFTNLGLSSFARARSRSACTLPSCFSSRLRLGVDVDQALHRHEQSQFVEQRHRRGRRFLAVGRAGLPTRPGRRAAAA